ncbi:PREDICTED: uncharacterized protein LOC106815749 [Priapulus caudatus]|uniref:Uncharacterized protein LOC106815749 n=1 Tax=Priapulus caudatus TaxID=37621 RepID=A0ABM1EU71_PRICU|nr:PREDICTED: uncharacterized protein LOC106815749 [Priapulus caudatus]
MYKKSLELLREDGLASTSLGLPLKARWLDLADTTNDRTDSTCAKLMIPIEGSTTRGLLLARASKEAVGWELEAVELLVEGARDKISIFQRQEEADRRHVLL